MSVLQHLLAKNTSCFALEKFAIEFSNSRDTSAFRLCRDMSFAIEVPGEANPLTEGTLLHVLRSASSSDPQQIQSGTKQLQQWEKSPGYYRQLQSVFMDRSLPIEVRYLAVIQLKNGIDKYWRKTAAK